MNLQDMLGNAMPNFTARVTNNGATDTGVGFNDVFEYSYDNGLTWTTWNTIPKSALGVGSFAEDAMTFTPPFSGVVLIQHCVDQFDVIGEYNETVADNCESIGPFTVTAPAPPSVSLSACELPARVNCDAAGSLTVPAGADVEVVWSSANATDCLLSGGVSDVGTSGVVIDSAVSGNFTYDITCNGSLSSVTDQISVTTINPADLVPLIGPVSNGVYGSSTYSSVSLIYSVRNDGDQIAGASVTRIEFDEGDNGSIDNTVNSPTASISASGGESNTNNLVIATDVPVGTHRITVTADVNNEVFEASGEGNNTQSFTFTLIPQDPGIDITGDAVVRGGDQAELSWNTNSTANMTCTVTGPLTATYPTGVLTTFNPSVDGQTGSVTTDIINAKFTFTLTCLEGSVTHTSTHGVEVAPAFQEV